MPNDAIANLLLRVRSETAEGEAGLARMFTAIKAFGAGDTEHEVKVETQKARTALQNLAKDLSSFARDTSEAGADLDTREARIHLNALEDRLRGLDRSRVSPEVDVNIAKALAKIAILRRAMSAESFRQGDVDVGGIARDMGILANQTQRVSTSMRSGRDAPNTFQRLALTLRTARANIGPFSVGIAHLGRLWLFLIPKTVAFAAGLLAIGSSAGAAVLGLGALGIAAAGALGPIAALTIGAVARFSSASEGVDKYRSAMQTLRGASEAQREAERNLSSAQREARDAQENLNLARKEASENIADDISTALAAVRDAEYNLSTAQSAQIAAQQSLTQAREDATRALIDMRLAAEGAALSEERAQISLIKARRNLAEAEESGIGGLALREARLEVQEAELALKTAREQGQRSVEDLASAEAKGINGSEQVVSARQAIADSNHAAATASETLADAMSDLADEQRRTVRTDEGVVAAREQVAAANRAVTEAQREVVVQTQKTERAQREANKAYKEAAPVLAGAGLALKKSIRGFRKDLDFALGPGINKLWRGVAQGLEQNLGPLVRSLRDEFSDLGGVIGDAIGEITAAMDTPGGREFFESMIKGAVELVPLMTRSFIAMGRMIGHIAQAAMPHLIDAFRDLAEWLESGADNTSNITLLGVAIGGLVSHARDWFDLFRNVFRMIWNVGRAAAGPGQNLVQWLSEVVGKFADWAGSAEGQQAISDFFKEMIPLFKGMLDLITEFLELALNLAIILGPAILVINRIFTTLLDIVNDILGVFADLPAPVRLVLGGFLLFRGPIAILRTLVGWLIRLATVLGAGRLLTAFGGIGTALATFGGRIRGVIGRLGGFSGALRAIPYVAAAAAVLEYGDDVGKAFASMLGYGDDYIKQQEAIADAQGVLSDSIYNTFRALPRALRNAVSALKGNRGIRDLFSDEELNVWAQRLSTGGKKAGRAWTRAVRQAVAEQKGTTDAASRTAGNIVNTFKRIFSNQGGLLGAGKSLMGSIIDGIRSMFPSLGGIVKKGARIIRNLLPGSEPKDPRSPLRRLDLAGKAIVTNMAKGMQRAQNNVPRNLAGTIAHQVTGGPRLAAGGGGGQTINNNQFDMRAHVAGGGFPDPDAYMAAVSRNLRKRGLSLQ